MILKKRFLRPASLFRDFEYNKKSNSKNWKSSTKNVVGRRFKYLAERILLYEKKKIGY